MNLAASYRAADAPGFSAWEALRNPDASPLPDPLANRTIADAHLERVLRGRDLLVQDGAIGTQLQAKGLAANGSIPDLACLTNPDIVTEVHREYVEAGAEMVTTNSFGANALKLGGAASVEEVCAAAVACAKASGARYVAGSMGPLGALLEPFGEVPFERAYELFLQQARALAAAGADVLTIETMSDVREAKAALLAAREACDLPVFASVTYGANGRTLFGTPPAAAAAILSSLGADVLGVNCSLGPRELLPIARELARASRCPVAVRPNAGMPRLEEGRAVYDVQPDEFAECMALMLDAGVSVMGGCCGTNPAFTRALAQLAARRGAPAERPYEPALRICSAQAAAQATADGDGQLEIAAAIDPADEDLLDDVRAGDAEAVADEAMDARDDADAVELDASCAGLAPEQERALLAAVVAELEETAPVPLVIRTDDPAALEAAVRSLAGKPVAGPARGGTQALAALLPVAKRYGCAVAVPGAGTEAEAAAQLAAEQGIPGEDVVFLG